MVVLYNYFVLFQHFSYLKLGCKHHGKCSSKGNNIRPKQKTMKIGCPAFIHMCVDRKRGGRLVIKDLCMQHNHQVSIPETCMDKAK